MKTTIYLLLFFVPNIIFAQITYTSSNFAEVGDSLLFSRATGGLDTFNFDTTGVNFHWDFSNLPFETQLNQEFVASSDAGYQFAWCLANGIIFNCGSAFNDLTNIASVGLESFDLGPISVQNVVDHYKKTTDQYAQTLLGITAQIGGLPVPLTFEYENPDTILRFPVEYQNTDSSTARRLLDFNGLGIPFKISQNNKRMNIVDGWGSLSTPYGDFDNTLRVKTIIQNFDTTFLDTTAIPLQTTLIEYKWFDPEFASPVLQANGTVAGNTEIIGQVTYIDSFRCVTPNPFFAYFPLIPSIDPATESATVEFTNLSSNTDSVQWDFGDGNISNELNPTHTFFCTGLKNVQLIGYNTLCDPTSADTITLPVFINDTTQFIPDTNHVELCQGDSVLINDEYVFESGFYEEDFLSTNGCDSFGIAEVEVIEIDTSVNVSSGTLTASQEDATYQWIDCDSELPISGATSSVFSPPTTGNFAVEIGFGGCLATSGCHFVVINSVEPITLKNKIRVYPNPFEDTVLISLEGNEPIKGIRVLNMMGEILVSFNGTFRAPFQLRLNHPSGIYILEIENELGDKSTFKLMKY